MSVSIVLEEAHAFCCRLISHPWSQPEMSIISYLSLSLSSLGVVHVGTAAYTSCLERGGEGENKTTAKKREPLPIWSHYKNVVPDTSGANSPPSPLFRQSEHAPSLFVLLYISSLCVLVCIFYIACLTECKEYQAFCLFAWIGPPHPQASVAPPLWVQEGRHTRLRGRAWGD